MRMTKHDEVYVGRSLRHACGRFAKSAPAVFGDVRAARVRAIRRELRREIGVQPAKRTNGHPVAQHASQRSIATVFHRAQSVAVLDVRMPTADVIDQRTEQVVDADVFAQDIPAPAVVVSRDQPDGNAGIDHVCERSQRAKSAAGNHRVPLEPKLEQIAVDHERCRAGRHVTKKRHDRPLDIIGRVAEVRVGHDVAGRCEHARILPTHLSLYKPTHPNDLRRVTNELPTAVSAPLHHDVEFRVRYAETDQMGVVYHANYLIWCEVGRTDFIRARGMSYAEMERSGVGLAVSELSARFHSAARYDDMIRVRTTLAEVRSRGIVFDYLVTNAVTGQRLVTARTALVSIDGNGRPTAIPASVRGLFDRA